MKTTIDIPETIYRKVKAKSAMEGRAVRDVAITLFAAWVDQNATPSRHPQEQAAKQTPPTPKWFASLNKYAANAKGKFDMESIRHSVEQGRSKKDTAA